MKLSRLRNPNLFHIEFSSPPELSTCHACGLIFHASNSDQQALEDFDQTFPGQQPAFLLCENCFNQLYSRQRLCP